MTALGRSLSRDECHVDGRIGRSWASVMQMKSLGMKGTLDTISESAFLLHFTFSSELHQTS